MLIMLHFVADGIIYCSHEEHPIRSNISERLIKAELELRQMLLPPRMPESGEM
jgi:hypothetical protein